MSKSVQTWNVEQVIVFIYIVFYGQSLFMKYLKIIKSYDFKIEKNFGPA